MNGQSPGQARRSIVWLAVAVASGAATSPAVAQDKVNELLQKNDIEFVGIWTDIPDRQNLGQREPDDAHAGRRAGASTSVIVYAWDVERTPDDRVAREHLLSVEHLRLAGVPAMPGSEPDFTSGMHGSERYRMAGILTSINIRGTTRYELKSVLTWQLYDTTAGSVVWEGSSNKMVRGAVLGDRGEPDNVLLESVLGALEAVLDKDVPNAIKRLD